MNSRKFFNFENYKEQMDAQRCNIQNEPNLKFSSITAPNPNSPSCPTVQADAQWPSAPTEPNLT
jgi:hypothetical protein